MSYTITTNILPAGSSFYVRSDATNPTTIEAGQTATLKFKADGTYYVLYKAQSSGVSVTGATITSWTCVKPFGEATLVIANATANVVVTVNAKQAITPLDYSRPFNLISKAPIDIRMVLTKQQMKEISDANQPEVYFAICKDDAKLYIYNKSAEPNSETGKFFVYETGGAASLIKGYYFNGKFYTDSTYTVEIVPNEEYLYADKNSGSAGHPENSAVLYYYNGTEYVSTLKTATQLIAGVMKLYNTHGQNTDGTMTQKSITDSIDTIKFSVEQVPDEDGDGEPENILILDKPW